MNTQVRITDHGRQRLYQRTTIPSEEFSDHLETVLEEGAKVEGGQLRKTPLSDNARYDTVDILHDGLLYKFGVRDSENYKRYILITVIEKDPTRDLDKVFKEINND